MNTRPGSILALVLGAVLLGAASWVNAADVVLRAAHNGFQGHPFDDGLLKLEEVLEARSGGAVDVQVFPAEQLGTEEQVTELVDLGTVAFNINGTAGISGFVPEAELLNLPFIFKDVDHFYRVIDGPVGNRIAQAMEDPPRHHRSRVALRRQSEPVELPASRAVSGRHGGAAPDTVTDTPRRDEAEADGRQRGRSCVSARPGHPG